MNSIPFKNIQGAMQNYELRCCAGHQMNSKALDLSGYQTKHEGLGTTLHLFYIAYEVKVIDYVMMHISNAERKGKKIRNKVCKGGEKWIH